MSYSTLKRTMTFKSRIGFGDYSDYTVQQMIDIGKRWSLVCMYFNLEKIDFTQEVKDVLCIKKHMEIPKPGKSYELRKIHTSEIIRLLKETDSICGRTASKMGRTE